jgi:hypothetical protein
MNIARLRPFRVLAMLGVVNICCVVPRGSLLSTGVWLLVGLAHLSALMWLFLQHFWFTFCMYVIPTHIVCLIFSTISLCSGHMVRSPQVTHKHSVVSRTRLEHLLDRGSNMWLIQSVSCL